jgi:hypothetical protein
MAIDMSKMRDRKRALDSRNNGSTNGVNFWRPQDGEQVIRIIPTQDGDPFKDYWFHYNVGNNTGFLSPKKNFGEDDPLDQFVRQLFNEGTDESRAMAKDLMAKQRFFAPVVVRGEEDRGVMVWGFSKTVYETLLNLVLNPEYGDITDPESGTDLVLSYGKPAGQSFPVTKITPRRRSSPLTNDNIDESYCAQLLDSVPDMTTLFERKTPEEVGHMLDGFLSGDDTAESSSKEVSYNSKTTSKEESVSSVDQAFDELLG